MKNGLSFLAAILFLTACADKTPEGNLHITVKVDGLRDGKLFIQKLQDSTFVVLDSMRISGQSSFESHLEIDSPEMFYLTIDRGVSDNPDNSLMFFAEPGNINIETTLERFYSQAKVTGSKNHELFEQYKAVNSRFNDQQLEITEAKLKAFKDQTPITEDMTKREGELTRKRYLYAINFALNNKDHEIAPYIALSEISDANPKYLDTINKSLSEKVADSKYGKLLSQYVSELKKQQ